MDVAQRGCKAATSQGVSGGQAGCVFCAFAETDRQLTSWAQTVHCGDGSGGQTVSVGVLSSRLGSWQVRSRPQVNQADGAAYTGCCKIVRQKPSAHPLEQPSKSGRLLFLEASVELARELKNFGNPLKEDSHLF
jgi:hypothetical protein